MKLILTDLDPSGIVPLRETKIIANNGETHPCIGCFGCWVKTPGVCVIRDGFQTMGKSLSKCTELILISRCVYGSYSPHVKALLDRAIGYISPYFVIRGGEMHHARRYNNKIELTAYFYGEEISEADKECARRLVQANAVNYDGTVKQVFFSAAPPDWKAVMQ